MKANASYFQSAYVTPAFTALEDTPQIPEAQKFLTWMANTHKTVAELSIQGWIAANQFVTGLKLAGPDFNRAKVIAALNSQRHFTADGFVAPIDWSVGHINPANRLSNPTGLDCFNWVKVDQGTFVPAFSQPGKPWLCFTVASETRTSSAPTTLPPTQNYSFVPTGG
jgi:hypothetical protein